MLTYDIGTTGTKCCLFTLEGTELAAHSENYDTRYPRPGWGQQRPTDYWEAVVRGTRAICEEIEIDPATICGIGLCGQMNGCVPLDSAGDPSYDAIIHLDSRSSRERELINEIIPEPEFYRLTGNRPDVHFSLPKIMWLARNEPEVYNRTAVFLQAKDYVGYRLTGNMYATDFSDASLTAALDMRSKCWAEHLIRAVGLDPAKFPEIHPSIAGRGALSEAAARTLGLPSGIPVAYGCGDAAAATRGAGVVDNTTSYVHVGSSAWMSTLLAEPLIDPHMRLQNFYDPDGTSCNACGSVQSAGICIDWVRGILLGRPEQSSGLEFDELEATAMQATPGADGLLFLPLLMGERTPYWDPHARGAFVGLTLGHNREHVVRAVFEGVAFALRTVLEALIEKTVTFRQIMLLGGGLRSNFWKQLICDVFALPCIAHTSPHNATGLGAAMVGAVAAGELNRLTDWPVSRLKGSELRPDANLSAGYEQSFRIYQDLYEQLKPTFHRTAVARRPQR